MDSKTSGTFSIGMSWSENAGIVIDPYFAPVSN